MQIIDRQAFVFDKSGGCGDKKRPGSVLPSPRHYVEVYKLVLFKGPNPD